MSRSLPAPKSPRLSLEERVAQLPAPQPGKLASLPLELAPFWLKYHNREVTGFDTHRFIYKIQPRAQQLGEEVL